MDRVRWAIGSPERLHTQNHFKRLIYNQLNMQYIPFM